MAMKLSQTQLDQLREIIDDNIEVEYSEPDETGAGGSISWITDAGIVEVLDLLDKVR